MKRIVIIGNGIAGITAARKIRDYSNFDIVVISKESKYFFSRPALMYVYMGHMRWADIEPFEKNFWSKQNIQLIHDEVINFDFEKNKIYMKEKGELEYDNLILATGSKPNELNCIGSELSGVHNFYSKDDLEKIEAFSHKVDSAVIVGGGLIGIELVEMFLSRRKKVSFLVRENSYWENILPQEESQLINKHIKEHHVNLFLNTELAGIYGNQKVEYIMTNKGQKIDCQFVGIAVGVRPNIDIFEKTKLKINRGILVNEYLETNIPNVFAIGDCAENMHPDIGRKKIEAVWYVGKKMGESVALTICKNKTKYTPGIWYNSAKFFDIEYQVYGKVSNKNEINEDSILFNTSNKSIRIVYDKNTLEVLGFNVLGIRLRQLVCEKWISSKTKIEEVIKDIHLAFFDPEFYKDCSKEIKRQYEEKFNTEITLTKKTNHNSIVNFLNA